MKIAQRTFIVSGGSSGLGKATAEMLLEEGAYISILDLNESEDLWKKPQNVKFIKTDITETKEIENAVSETVEWAAQNRAPLGGVINCAGVGTAAKVRYICVSGCCCNDGHCYVDQQSNSLDRSLELCHCSEFNRHVQPHTSRK